MHSFAHLIVDILKIALDDLHNSLVWKLCYENAYTSQSVLKEMVEK